MLRDENEIRTVIIILINKIRGIDDELDKRRNDIKYENNQKLNNHLSAADLKEARKFINMEKQILQWVLCENVWCF